MKNKQGQTIEEWIEEAKNDKSNRICCATTNCFGLVKFEDGRKAEIQVNLELDKGEWKRDY